jgi:hypothetical protein
MADPSRDLMMLMGGVMVSVATRLLLDGRLVGCRAERRNDTKMRQNPDDKK